MKRVSPHVAIVMPVWNGMDDTLACLESLAKLTYPSFSIIVVDNGSTDGTAETVSAWSKQHLHVLLVRLEENRGFTRGCNTGIRRALEQESSYVLLLNNDTEVTPDMLSILVETAETDARIGMTGPKVYKSGPGHILDCAGVRAIPWLAQPFLSGHGEEDTGQYDTRRAVPYITGCALLIKRAVIERIGLLDEDFTNYFEDFDWGYRANRHGYRLLYTPEALIRHKGSQTSGLWSPFYYYHNTRSRVVFARKHSPMMLFLFAFLPYLMAYRYLLPGIRLLKQRKWAHLRALHQGVKDGLTARLTSKSR